MYLVVCVFKVLYLPDRGKEGTTGVKRSLIRLAAFRRHRLVSVDGIDGRLNLFWAQINEMKAKLNSPTFKSMELNIRLKWGIISIVIWLPCYQNGVIVLNLAQIPSCG